MPVFSALGQLCREPDGQQLIQRLTEHAPTWLVEMPTLLSMAELEALQRKTQGATQERMLRSSAEAVEALTVKKLLVLVLEDLHWSDVSTLDSALVLGPAMATCTIASNWHLPTGGSIGTKHPLHLVKQELQLHGQCKELALGIANRIGSRRVSVVMSIGSFGGAPRAALLQRIRSGGPPTHGRAIRSSSSTWWTFCWLRERLYNGMGNGFC